MSKLTHWVTMTDPTFTSIRKRGHITKVVIACYSFADALDAYREVLESPYALVQDVHIRTTKPYYYPKNRYTVRYQERRFRYE